MKLNRNSQLRGLSETVKNPGVAILQSVQMKKDEILNFLKANKKFFEKRYKVTRIGLFGSYSINKQSQNSDIDIIVSMPSDFDNYYDLKEFLEYNLKSEVDLALEKNMRQLIKKHIENEIIYV